MLDVHPPHEPVHGWRDFLIHLLTITVGLLIALGLEAIAEDVHHRHQVRETRDALQREREENRRRFAANTAYLRRQAATLENNLMVLDYVKSHPGVKQADMPGFLNWTSANAHMTESVWKTAQQTGVFSFMPPEEIRRDAELYDFLERIEAAHEAEAAALLEALRYTLRDPDPTHMAAPDLGKEQMLVETVLLKHLAHGLLMEDLASEFPDFKPAPSHLELLRPTHLPEFMRSPDLQKAVQLTMQRADEAAANPHADKVPDR